MMQTTIYKDTFRDCSSLTSISLPPSISAIDECAFRDCSSLQNVDMGTNVSFIGTSAFTNCTSLYNVDRFNDKDSAHTFDKVCNYAFANTGLRSVNLALRSSSIYTFWGDGCFQDCKDLLSVHFLSANYMSRNMFKDCKKLEYVSCDNNQMAYTYPGIYSGCTKLKDIILPSQFLFLPEEMFKDCVSLDAIKFKDYAKDNSKLTLVQKNAFNGCTSLKQISFPETINNLSLCIEDAALSNVVKLNRLDLPGIQVDLIGDGSNFPTNIPWGWPYEVRTVDELKHVLDLYHNMVKTSNKYRLYIVFEFECEYWPHDNPEYGYYPDYSKDSTDVKQIARDFVDKDKNERELYRYYVIYVHAICRVGATYEQLGQSFSEQLSNYIDQCNSDYENNEYENSLYTYLRFINAVNEIKKPNIYFCDCFAETIDTYSNKLLMLNSKKADVRQHTKPYQHYSSDNSDAVLLQKTSVRNSITYRGVNYYKQEYVNVDEFIIFSSFLESNQLYRGLAENGSKRISIHANGGTLEMPYDNSKEKPYVPLKEYISDRQTTTNFKIAKDINKDCAFYYNARELYAWAREKNTPCLFIYSLWGCGPCMVYQANLWRNPEFQSWFKKQKFYLCGMEVESQPMYDNELQFCTDYLSIQAKNFATVTSQATKPPADTPANGFGEIFKRWPVESSYASNLMTPVLIFMDKNGNCFDYTYHDIENQIQILGVEKVIQCLKSLCLYHFDENSLVNPQYVVDAGKTFNKDDYELKIQEDWYDERTKTIDLTFKNHLINSVYAAYEDMWRQLKAKNAEDTLVFNKTTNMYDVYLGGCYFTDIDYLSLVGGGQLAGEIDMQYTTNSQKLQKYANSINEIIGQYTYKIENAYYKLVANAKKTKKGIDTCSDGHSISLLNVTFESV